MDKKLTKAQQKLITINYKLLENYVHKTIKQKHIPPYLIDEFVSEIFYRFCKSALTYDKNTGFKFSTYAYGGFSFGLKDIMGRQKRNLAKIYSFEEIEGVASDELEIKKFEMTSLDDFVNKIKLNPRDKLIIKDYYYNRMSLREVGDKYKISKEGARLIIKKVLKQMKAEASENKLDFEDFYI